MKLLNLKAFFLIVALTLFPLSVFACGGDDLSLSELVLKDLLDTGERIVRSGYGIITMGVMAVGTIVGLVMFLFSRRK